MNGATVYTWSNFGKLAAGEEIAGGGPEDPSADLVVLGTGIVFLGGAFWQAAHPDTVRVCRERNPEFCLVGPYGKIKDTCKEAGGETHHIVPDMVYRLGARPANAAEDDSTADRIPTSPTFSEGMSICLTTGEHRTDEQAVHKTLKPAINALGTAPGTVGGTAPMSERLGASLFALSQVDGVSDKCKELAGIAASIQADNILDQPGRATTSLPLFPAARDVLLRVTIEGYMHERQPAPVCRRRQ